MELAREARSTRLTAQAVMHRFLWLSVFVFRLEGTENIFLLQYESHCSAVVYDTAVYATHKSCYCCIRRVVLYKLLEAARIRKSSLLMMVMMVVVT